VRFRVVSWNLDSGATGRLDDKIDLLRRLEPDLALLQELNRPVHRALLPHPLVHGRIHARPRIFSWGALSTDLIRPKASDYRVGCAVLGSASTILLDARLLDRAPFDVDEAARPGLLRRTMAARVGIPGGVTVTACSFQARPVPSRTDTRVKPAFHAGIAAWIAVQSGPVLFGMDAHAPEVDHPEHRCSRFLRPSSADGGPGEDRLLGHDPDHGLADVLRRHLAAHPEELVRIRADRPSGPLAVSYRTAGGPARYDHIWASTDLEVTDVRYLYDEALAAGSDHGLVLADFEL